jgi:hypothetical protein
LVTQERLRELFDYDPVEGILIRRFKKNNAMPGPVGLNRSSKSRYPQIFVDNKAYALHRLIWIWVHGQIPDGMCIDHINGETMDNRIDNLRLASPVENWRNRRIRRGTKSGYKGVSKQPYNYTAYLSVGGVRQHLGSFKTAEEAAAAYDSAAEELYGEFARTNKSMGLLDDRS